MASWHRVALRGLLAVAVAVHGSAGMAMVGCDAPQPTGVSMHGADAARSEHAAHSKHADRSDRAVHSARAARSVHLARSGHALHSGHAVEPLHASLEATSAHAGTDSGTDSGHAKGGACAACCVAAMPATVLRLAAVANTDTFAPAPPSMAPVFETGGLERPPRPRGA